jgi:hypothetical protein
VVRLDRFDRRHDQLDSGGDEIALGFDHIVSFFMR